MMPSPAKGSRQSRKPGPAAGNPIETNGSSVTLSGAVNQNRKQRNAASGRRATKGRNPLLVPGLTLIAGLALIVTFAAPWRRPAPTVSQQPQATASTKPPLA